MPDTIAPRSPAAPLVVAAAAAIALTGTGLLWFHYGTAVFFETLRAGFIACFG